MGFMLLTERLPEEVVVCKKAYPIHTDFRHWIQLEVLLFEDEGDFLQKIPRMLKLCYRTLPETLEVAIAGIADFYKGGAEKNKKVSGGGKTKPLYSFLQDEALIYAGFYQQYGIDLSKEKLHWWQFKALFSGLSQDTALAKAMHVRAVDLSTVKNPEERQFYRRMKAFYRLRDTQTAAEKEAAVTAALSQLF